MRPEYSSAYFASERARRPGRFGVVTAWHPRGRTASAAKNREADARLSRRIDALGLERFRVTGGSRDGSHREPGWGIVAPGPGVVRRLAREFRQLGFYWVEDGRILLGASSGGRLRPAGLWRSRKASWKP